MIVRIGLVAVVALMGLAAGGAAVSAEDVTHSRTPLAPDQLAIDSCYLRCGSPAVVHTLRPTLEAAVNEPRGGQLDVDFEVRLGRAVIASGTVSNVSSGTVRWRPGSDLPAAQPLRFRARAANEHRTGPWSRSFVFTTDTDPPATPTVTSEFYPPSDTGGYHGGIGVPGAFTFSSGSSDVIEYAYQWLGGGEGSVQVSEGSAVTVELAPPGDFVQRLEVRAIDPAGNVSDWQHYTFLVNPQPSVHTHWKFDEGTGAVANPVPGGGGQVGTLRGNAGWAASGINPDNPTTSGTAVSLDGTTAFVEMPPVLTIPAHSAGITVTAWANPDQLTGPHTVVAQSGQSTTMLAIYYDPDQPAWCLQVTGSDDAAAARAVACSPAVPLPDTWTHLSAVYDRVAGIVQLWVNGGPNNGEPTPGTVTTVDAPAGQWTAAGPFTVGGSPSQGSFAGRIDEVKAYQRVLSESEILHTFLQCRYGFCP